MNTISKKLSPLKKMKETPDDLTFYVTQTKTTHWTLDYESFTQNYVDYFGEEIETDDEFDERCKKLWKKVCYYASDCDEIALDEADCDDEVDEEYVCDGTHEFIETIINAFNKVCPYYKKYKELQDKKLEEEKKHIQMLEDERKQKKEAEKQQKIAELTAELEKLRSS
jgi:hypothetical protein